MSATRDHLGAARAALTKARSVVVLTGAGISAESGIPTFRGGMQALWRSFDPQTLATPEAFAADPKTVTEWYDWRRLKCREAIPNAGHLALVRLERLMGERGGTFTLLTQNVDRLHQRAGSASVVELHSNIMQWRCERTGAIEEPGEGPIAPCPWPSRYAAGAHMRPCVVWFGEALPERALRAAGAAADACDVFISVGTSAVVYPAAGFIDRAAANGAVTIEVNKEQTPASSRVDHPLRGAAGEILPDLIARG